MPINYSAILPHGFDLIPDLYPNSGEDWKKLIKAIEGVAKAIFESKPDIIVIASPHNLRIDGYIGVINTEWYHGTWWNEEKTKSVEMKLSCAREFGLALYNEIKEANLPVVSVNYGAADGEFSSMILDWGTFIPLWFVNQIYIKNKEKIPPILLITPSREIPWEDLVEVGRLINKLSNDESKEVVFISSADHGHAHDEEGPYGYDPASKIYDDKVIQIIERDELHKLLDFTEVFIEHAKPDSLWQMLILHGIIEETYLRNEICIYECPTYYGMIVASFMKK
jgi:aromatic ring-opening dioxygenase LigB subunit